jgi:hypothetical protein
MTAFGVPESAGASYDRWAEPELRDAGDWISLYEADGDWVFADTAADRTVYTRGCRKFGI